MGWGRCTATFLIVLTLLRQYFATKWMNVRWRQNRLCQEFSSCEALERWIALYVQLIVTKRGLASVLHSGESAYADLPAYFETRLVSSLEKLLPHVTGNIRDNTLATDTLRGIALLCAPAAKGDLLQTQRLVKLFLKGIRAGDDIHGD
ncbi:hypothetical protein LNO18_12075 [Klebsiella variicola subsp. variicola]|nr:hypothetical protein [Klebsiella variicola subsp. variicola]